MSTFSRAVLVFFISIVGGFSQEVPLTERPPYATTDLSPTTASSTRQICPDNWLKVSTAASSEFYCVHIGTTRGDYAESLDKCRQNFGHLLILNEQYLSIQNLDIAGLYNFLEPELSSSSLLHEEFWIGCGIQNGKIWWDEDTPKPLYWKSWENFPWEWIGGEDGCCKATIAPSGRISNFFNVSLVDCNRKLYSVCINKGISVNSGIISHCEDGWLGSPFSQKCYKYSEDLKSTYRDAMEKCQSMGGSLATPTTPSQNEFAVSVFDQYKIQAKDAWIGVKLESTIFVFENGYNLSRIDILKYGYIKRTSSTNGCVTLVTDTSQGIEWKVIDPCTILKSFLCQKNASGVPAIVQQPRDILTGTKDLLHVPTKNITLSCNITHYHPDFKVIWVKDGQFIQNDYPPQGFILNLSRLAEIYQAYNIETLQGIYHCEAWTMGRFRRIQSGSAVVKFTDIFTFRGAVNFKNSQFNNNLTLANIFFNNPFRRDPIVPSFYTNKVKKFLVLQQKNASGNVGYKIPNIIVTKYSPGSVIVHCDIYFSLWDLTQNWNLETADLPSVINDLETTIYDDLNGRELNQSIYLQDIRMTNNVSCPESSILFDIGNLRLPLTFKSTAIGTTSASEEVCLVNGNPLATRICEGDFSKGLSFGPVEQIENCPQDQLPGVTEDIKMLSETETNGTNAEIIVGKLQNYTNTSEDLNIADIVYTSIVLDNVASVKDSSVQVGSDMVKVANNVLMTGRTKIGKAQKVGKASTRILHSLELYSVNMNLSGRPYVEFVEENIALEIWKVDDIESSIIGIGKFDPVPNKALEKSYLNYFNESHIEFGKVDTAILCSRESLTQALEKQTIANKLNAIVGGEPNDLRVTFSVFENSHFFMTDLNEEGNEKKENEVNSKVISASFGDITIKNLSQPIKIAFLPLERQQNDSKRTPCVFWDFKASGGLGNWSTEGCYYFGEENGRQICHCDHMTNFAILLDPQQKTISGDHLVVLSIISIIGLSLSIAGLSFTILTFITFKHLRKGNAQKILVNLAIALLCVNIIFLAGINRTENYYGCLVVAALLHYFLLVAFAWMLVEAVYQYLKFVKVLDSYVQRFMLKASIPAWVLPAVPVIAVGIYDYDLFRGPSNYCWLALQVFYYAFLIPVAVIIIINTVLFTMVIKSITCDRPKGLTSTQSVKDLQLLQLRAGICCFVVLGITWILGFFAINVASLIFQYLFCIFNSIQGFLIFIFHNLREEKVRQLWKRKCCGKHGLKSTYSSNDQSQTTLSSHQLSQKHKSQE